MVLGSSRKRADIHNNHILTNSAPLGRVGPRVAMSVCLCVCLSAPSSAVFFKASHWPSGHMIRSLPLIDKKKVAAKSGIQSWRPKVAPKSGDQNGP